MTLARLASWPPAWAGLAGLAGLAWVWFAFLRIWFDFDLILRGFGLIWLSFTSTLVGFCLILSGFPLRLHLV